MTSAERSKVKDLSKCDFKDMAEYYKDETEKRKNRSKEEKKAELELKKKEVEDYGTAIIDGHKQKIGNFRIEPPGQYFFFVFMHKISF
jgi:DNA topoisomerase-1